MECVAGWERNPGVGNSNRFTTFVHEHLAVGTALFKYFHARFTESNPDDIHLGFTRVNKENSRRQHRILDSSLHLLRGICRQLRQHAHISGRDLDPTGVFLLLPDFFNLGLNDSVVETVGVHTVPSWPVHLPHDALMPSAVGTMDFAIDQELTGRQ
jgi:hypothetical protein